MPHPIRIACLAALALAPLARAADVPAEVESEPVLEAAALVQPSLLSGPGFSVDPHVELRGYMAHFVLDTRIGRIDAGSVEILVEREAEMPALEALDQATHSGAFLRAAGGKFASTGRMLGQIVLHPVDTVLGIPSGVARYFGSRLKKIATQAQSLSDRAGRRFGNHGNPYPADEGPMTDARTAEAADADVAKKPEKHWYSSIGDEVRREVKRQAGYDRARRDIAQRLGIDPYTSNPYVRERLSGLAWAGAGGGLGAGGALGLLGAGAGQVLSQGSRINDVVWKLSPEDLRARNAERLRAHCSDDLLVRQFLRRGAFSPTLQTALADLLDELHAADGCNALLELAITADSELEARFVVNALRLLSAHLGARSKGGTLRPIGAGLAYAAADGELVLPLAVDRLSWTDEVRRFIERDEFRVERKTVLVGGDASLLARRNLAARGWSVVLRAPRPGAPPYARGEPAPVDLED